jgi:hypothetical protein
MVSGWMTVATPHRSCHATTQAVHNAVDMTICRVVVVVFPNTVITWSKLVKVRHKSVLFANLMYTSNFFSMNQTSRIKLATEDMGIYFHVVSVPVIHVVAQPSFAVLVQCVVLQAAQ